MNILPLETERLLLRKIKVTDAPFFYELFNSESWLQYIGDRNIKTIADAKRQIIEKYIPSYNKNGYGSYLVIEKTSGLPIGSCGLYKRDNLEHPDIGFAFLPQFTGKGFGFESSKAVLKEAKKALNISKVLAFTVPHNTTSIKLLEKLGLKNTGNYFFKEDPEPLLLFEKAL